NTNIKINIVEPGSSTPVDPTPIDPVDPSDTTNTTNTTTYTSSTDVSVPDTGLFTHGIGGTEATIITISTIALLLTIIATIATVLYKKHIRQGKVTKLVRTIEQTKTIKKSKKRTTAALSAIALLASVGTLAILLANSNKTNTNAIEGGTELTVDVDSSDLTIEVGDTPVFAYLPVKLTVEEATTSGYVLSAYAEDTNLVSTTDESNIIPMVAIPEEDLSKYVSLTDNAWGLSLTEPQDQNSEVYTALSIDQNNPTILKTIDDYSETNANDKTTIYYGFYITPDTPKGTYEGSNITYTALTNPPVATVTFDGNGLYFDGDKATNIVRYEEVTTAETEKYSHTPNITDDGTTTGTLGTKVYVNEIVSIPGAESLHIKYSYAGGVMYDTLYGFGSFWEGSHPGYSPDNDYSLGIQNCGNGVVTDGRYYSQGLWDDPITVECNITGDTVTFGYKTKDTGPEIITSYGYYAVVTGYDADGNIVHLEGYESLIGEYKDPSYKESEAFLGWSTDPDATSIEYATEYEIAKYLTSTAGEDITLYAVWSPMIDVSYNGNNATAGSMQSTDNNGNTTTLSHQDMIAGDSIDLYAPNYKKTGYGFTGWSTDPDAWSHLVDNDDSNNPTIYGPNQSIPLTKEAALAITEEGEEVTLYAVWVPAETDNNGNPVSLQDWQGCSNLTATTYDSDTGTLSVGKNTITVLTDSRDGNVYTVARLADGNCWMTENLRLGSDASISAANTNKPKQSNYPPYGSISIRNNDGFYSNHLSPSTRSWCFQEYNATCSDQSYLNTDDTNLGGEGTIASYSYDGNWDDTKAFQWYSYGNMYNWYSTTAGNGVQDIGSGVTVVGDICPIGWRLPMGNGVDDSSSFYYLNKQMGGGSDTRTLNSNNWRSFPNNFVYSGSQFGSRGGRGERGNYWGATASGASSVYSLYIDNALVNLSNNNSKAGGAAVRCMTLVQ
ncbi:MAG: hypothetical protein U0L97_02605, partial [Candidatus Saccharimonadaceae bacterium]|nr:hypothetical protein [Candidatus Saccharimonadaceae bacterium]